ncbi:MAG: hypothetical protein K6A92_08060 [Lachnospiraceae bacterium]|nr:hypothetical protein [Lachnospiraceae bacterium]
MRKNNRVKITATCLCLILSLLTGCAGTQPDDGRNEVIELKEPKGVQASYAVISRKNLYSEVIYTATVGPRVQEYAFENDQTFKKYGANPGAKVSRGSTLIYCDTKEISQKIEDLEEEIATMEADHTYDMGLLEEDLKDARKEEEKKLKETTDMYKDEPDPDSVKEHALWSKEIIRRNGLYERAMQARAKIEQAILEKEELYQLDHDFKLDSLERLKQKKENSYVSSGMTGEVVSCAFYYDGDKIPKNRSVVAVGDTNDKVVKTEYIAKGTILKAQDLYALINGQRYELDYETMEPEDYNRLNGQGETVYTTFRILDDTETVQVGDFATIVLVQDKREDVLTVPLDALKKEEDGYYAYLYDGYGSTYVPVTIGMRDDLYAEVLSGLSEGDKVLSSQAAKEGTKKATLSYGNSITTTDMGGFLYYPFSEWVTNPAKMGTCYVKKVYVTNYQQVKKGQQLASIEIIPDTIEIQRLSRQIQRMDERFLDMEAEMERLKELQEDTKNIIRSMNANRNAREKLDEKRQKMASYSGIISLTAPFNGIVTQADSVKEGDLLLPDAKVIQVANDALSYILIQDEKHTLNYGNKAMIQYTDANGDKAEAEGKVVSAGPNFLSKEMVNDWALVSIPKEIASSMAGVTLGSTGSWGRNSFRAEITLRSTENVLLVPKSAVTLKNKSTYVNVVLSDGSIQQRAFVAGGSDTNNYWVVEGLTEGMTICWE